LDTALQASGAVLIEGPKWCGKTRTAKEKAASSIFLQDPDYIRFAVDERGESGQFILTGSAVPLDNAVRHTGTGRISRMLMRPMSLFESLESSGDVSLKSLFDGDANVEGFSSLTIERRLRGMRTAFLKRPSHHTSMR